MAKPSRTVVKVSAPESDGRTESLSHVHFGTGLGAAAKAEKSSGETETRLLSLLAELSHMARLNAAGEMFAAMAHELNQPLTAINNFVGTARRMLDGSGETSVTRIREMIDHAAAQTMRAGAIVHGLRAFAEKRGGERLPEHIDAVIGDAVLLAFAGLPPSGVVMTVDVEPDLPPLVIDKVQIEQVLVNLIRNAVEAMRAVPRRELTIAAKAVKRHIRLSVCDTGPGLAPASQVRLFEPFVTTKKDGMGVGLAICKTIVEAHGGRICAESVVGEGARFHVHLPIAKEGLP